MGIPLHKPYIVPGVCWNFVRYVQICQVGFTYPNSLDRRMGPWGQVRSTNEMHAWPESNNVRNWNFGFIWLVVEPPIWKKY